MVTRPVLRYHGGKWRMAPKIIPLFPPHRCYVEPFGGAASILLRKPRSYAEVYNELDPEIVNVFRVLRDPVNASRLKDVTMLTPFSREEFLESYIPSENSVEQARRTIFRACAGFGSASASKAKTGFRANSNRSGTIPAHDWANWPSQIEAFSDRLRGVVIENQDALHCMATHDSFGTLHYVDPPYVEATRSVGATKKGVAYRFEMSDRDHRELLQFLKSLKGMVVLSGYRSDLYEQMLGDWERHDFSAHADGARDRVESVWLNPAAFTAKVPRFEMEVPA